jgi:hypothetical protein
LRIRDLTSLVADSLPEDNCDKVWDFLLVIKHCQEIHMPRLTDTIRPNKLCTAMQ